VTNSPAVPVADLRAWDRCREVLRIRQATVPRDSICVATQVLCIEPRSYSSAAKVADEFPAVNIRLWFLDRYRAAGFGEAEGRSNLQCECSSDLAPAPIDLALLPNSFQGDAELTRDFLQSAHQHLRPGGELIAASDNPRDRWLLQQLKGMFAIVRPQYFADSVCYLAVKEKPLKRVRSFSAEIVFRDRDRLLRLVSRPGVFSHRELDVGARRLLDAAEVSADELILDIGCGTGAVGIGLAARAPQGKVLAIDSHTRAVECAQRGATLNGLTNLIARLDCEGETVESGKYTLALANPPYYAHFRIARHFVDLAAKALRPGGRFLCVTKHPWWYKEHAGSFWSHLEIEEVKGYWLVRARLE
jgi:16S rRNA (guanine1207-N2)-methyltransferase